MPIPRNKLFKYAENNIVPNGAASADTAMISALPSNAFEVGDFKSVRLIPFGTDTANENFTYKIWAIHRIEDKYDEDPSLPAYTRIHDLGTGLCTLGTHKGLANTVVNASQFVADTMTWTESTYMTHINTAFQGGTDVFSPTSNGVAELVIYDVGDCHYIWIDIYTATAATANFLVALSG